MMNQMNILEQIVAVKKKEVAYKRSFIDLKFLRTVAFDMERVGNSLKTRLLANDNTHIIAEYKKKSPSKGWINQEPFLEEIVESYETHDAAGISILTDEQFFGGSLQDLSRAKAATMIPLLRKDFIIDEIQIQEAKAYGADVILLIAAILKPARLRQLAIEAKKYKMEVLLEIHSKEELGHICDEVDMVGVNNRNLGNFQVNIQTSLDLIGKIPSSKVPVTESGISDVETIVSLKKAGYKGFLIGELFMKRADPAIAFAEFVQQLKAASPLEGGRREA
jgi:indole-3-glycerol phosphate synthase